MGTKRGDKIVVVRVECNTPTDDALDRFAAKLMDLFNRQEKQGVTQ